MNTHRAWGILTSSCVSIPRVALYALLGIATVAIGVGNFPKAQAASPITPSGLNTQVSPPIITGSGSTQTTQYNITGGTRPGGGVNLFHGFGDFNVPTNNIANFLNDSGLATSNILGRVTGVNPSVIYGAIQTTGFFGPNGTPTNLFLMNPYGFLFGPNATLNIGGMVAFTTADYLRFQGVQTVFDNASTPQSLSLLTSAPVAAFGFLGSNPAAIAVQGSTLTVAPGQSISLVGGNRGFDYIDPDTGIAASVPGGITMAGGKLSAPGGQINLASAASPGEVSATDFMLTPGMTMGNISLSQGAQLDVSADAAGTVRIRGGQLMIADATLAADTGNTNGASTAIDINLTGDLSITDTRGIPAIMARTLGAGDAGEIQIASGNLTASTTFSDPSFAPIAIINSHTEGTGRGGNVTITTGNLSVTNLSEGQSNNFTFIESGTAGPGHGGDVTITAKNIDLVVTRISTGDQFSTGFGLEPSGSAGDLNITADMLKTDHSIFSTEAFAAFSDTQAAGDITLNVHAIDMRGKSLVTAAGIIGGSITINADTLFADASAFDTFTVFDPGPGRGSTFNGRVLELTNGSTWSTSTFGDGAAGDIHVTATDHVNLIGITGTDPQGERNPSGFFSNSLGIFGSQGASGNIVVTTPRLTMQAGRINASTASSGAGGNITINAGVIEMSGEFPTPTTGDFFFDIGNIHPSGLVTQTVGSESCTGPCGNAGNINITTESLVMGAGSQINSGTTNTGQGGNITIQATNIISMSGTLSDGSPVGVFSRSVGTTPDAGSGGNIAITAGQSVTISDGASVSASTTGPGNAGNILVNANDVTLSGGGTIVAASTGAGNAGTVTLQGTNSAANSFLVDGSGSGVFTNTEDIGAGGSISVDANAVTLQNGGTISASTSGTSSSATGGTISISGGQFVQLTNGASITASSTGPGNTGNIQINAGNQFAMTNSTVTTEANKSGGGVIKITTNPNGTVQFTDSTISASVLDGTGGGGSVNIDPQFVILQNSQILADAVFGPGGNINITTNLLLPDSTSVIRASSQFGQQGTIIIQSPISPASGKIVPLGQKPLLPTSLLSQRCAALAGGTISSFTVAGRDSLPAEPGGWLSSPLALTTGEMVGSLATEPETRTSLRGSTEEMPVVSLRRIAPPGFLSQSFAADRTTGCTS